MPTKPTSFRIEEDALDKLRILAKRAHRSMTGQVEHYIATDWEQATISSDRMQQYAATLSDARAKYTKRTSVTDPTLRGKLAFTMYLVDFEAEHLPGKPQDLCILATRWGSFQAVDDESVQSIATNYYALADRMIAHWSHHADQATLERCALTDERTACLVDSPPKHGRYRCDGTYTTEGE